MDDKRIDSIEERTRKVEDAIIRFEYIADTILVQVENRLQALEKHDEELQAVMYNTCDVKSKEIDTKVNDASISLRSTFEKYFQWSVAISCSMFLLFISYVAYDQGQKESIGESITNSAVDAQESRTHIELLHNAVDKISDKLDRIVDNQATLIERNSN